MMSTDNLLPLKDDMVAFIAGHGLQRLPVPLVLFLSPKQHRLSPFERHVFVCTNTRPDPSLLI